MWTYTTGEIASLSGGTLLGDGNACISGVYTDSRGCGEGKLFVALKGENFDGHDFVDAAVRGGAGAIMLSRRLNDCPVPQIVVGEPLHGLTLLATGHRKSFKKKVAAVTGSAGKTTTRSLIATILGVSGKILEPEKNYNNHIGVPLTAMNLDNSFDAAVFELGCSDFNEIGPLARIVNPDVALITNVGEAHLEKLKNLEGVAQAKGELFAALRLEACAVVNLDDAHIRNMPCAADRVVTFSTGDTPADVQLMQRIPGPFNQQLRLRLQGTEVDVPFSLPGIHNATDATAAAAASLAMGAGIDDIIAGLGKAKARPGRFDIVDKNGLSIVDDTYNANPSSMIASLNVLAEMVPAEQRMAVLGDMLELGDKSESAHLFLGKAVATIGVKTLFLYGEFKQITRQGAVSAGMPSANIVCSDDVTEISKKVVEISKSGDALLIKGSRGMKLERVVRTILEG